MYQNYLLKGLSFLHWTALVSCQKMTLYEWVYSLDYPLYSIDLYVHPFDNTIPPWLLYLFYSIFEIKNPSFLFCYSSDCFGYSWLLCLLYSFCKQPIYMKKKSCWYFDWIYIKYRQNFVLNWHFCVERLNPWMCYVFI